MCITGIACETPEGILGFVPDVAIDAKQVINIAKQDYAVANTPEIPEDWEPIMMNDKPLIVTISLTK